MKPETRGEWRVILDLLSMIRSATAEERQTMLTKIEQKETGDLKLHGYRDMLEAWADWWNGPGREGYRGMIIPPLTKFSEVMKCLICEGIKSMDGGRCAACGRDVSFRNFGA